MSALKDIYSPHFYDSLSMALKECIDEFESKKFIAAIFSNGFESMELKARMRHTTMVLHEFLPDDFKAAGKVLEKLISVLIEHNPEGEKLAYIFLPDYIEIYGIDNFETSIPLLEFTTQFISCEFAVRPFIVKYGDKMMQQMLQWSVHSHFKVRRLASEGSRPRLPWAMALPELKKDPTSLLPILENLKNDPSDYVRRSVANNINDIAKGHPEVVIALAKKWAGKSAATDAVIKHGCRTLLKLGNPEILKLYGLDTIGIIASGFSITTPIVEMGESVWFTFRVTNDTAANKTVRLEYAMYFMKSKGHLAKKVFKISERSYAPGETAIITRKQSFRPITTRVYYKGKHELALIINGLEMEALPFEVI